MVIFATLEGQLKQNLNIEYWPNTGNTTIKGNYSNITTKGNKKASVFNHFKLINMEV